MHELKGRTAFVTGAASGIGLAIARGCGEAGMKVMLADIEEPTLALAVEGLREAGLEAQGVVCDVADPASLERAAETTAGVLGNVHLLVNNAGVAGGSGSEAIDLATWRWVLDVNLMGVVNGIAAFLPAMRAHGEAGRIVNVASMAGHVTGLGFSPYVASKFAVVGISEGLAMELEGTPLGVTVVCPGFVRTRIREARRNRQARYGPAPPPSPEGAALAADLAARSREGMDPSQVADITLAAVREGRLWAFPHPEMREEAEARFSSILEAMRAS